MAGTCQEYSFSFFASCKPLSIKIWRKKNPAIWWKEMVSWLRKHKQSCCFSFVTTTNNQNQPHIQLFFINRVIYDKHGITNPKVQDKTFVFHCNKKMDFVRLKFSQVYTFGMVENRFFVNVRKERIWEWI